MAEYPIIQVKDVRGRRGVVVDPAADGRPWLVWSGQTDLKQTR